MKYIVTETKKGTEEIFIFPNTVNHDCMAEVLCHIKDQSWGIGNVCIVSRLQQVLLMGSYVGGGVKPQTQIPETKRMRI